MAERVAEITGLILAGGKSSRMGSFVGASGKALLPISGTPMIEHVIARFSPQVDRLLINANTSRVGADLPFSVVSDLIADQPGPLAGLHAGLSCAGTPLLACVPCDAPLLPTDLVARLHAALVANAADVAVARTESGLQPTFLLCNTALAAAVKTYLTSGQRSLQGWLAQQRCIEVAFAEESAFININTPQDVARHEQQPK